MNIPYLSAGDRLKLAPLFASGLPYFRSWRTLSLYLAMLMPVIASSAALWMRSHGSDEAVLFGVVGFYIATSLFVSFCSGKISSYWGTHYRHREPKQFWGQVAFETTVYAAFSLAGYFV